MNIDKREKGKSRRRIVIPVKSVVESFFSRSIAWAKESSNEVSLRPKSANSTLHNVRKCLKDCSCENYEMNGYPISAAFSVLNFPFKVKFNSSNGNSVNKVPLVSLDFLVENFDLIC